MKEQSFLDFVGRESGKLVQQTLEHIGLTFISVLLSVLIAVPLGIWISRRKKASGAILGIVGVIQTIPSIALLGFMIPLLGIGWKPAIVALFLYALLPVLRNTYTGITGVDANLIDAAKAMGMNRWQVLTKVELPLSFQVIMAGIRTATVINVGVATLAAYIAAGGLGEFIFGGIALNNTNMILAGAIPAALLAILLDRLLGRLQQLRIKGTKTIGIVAVLLVFFSFFYFIPAGGNNKLKAGFTPEFMGRRDGDIGLKQVYGLDIHTVVINDAVMYKAAYEHKLDVISGYSTDGRLKAFDLVNLEDDKHVFPPYYVAPLIRQDFLSKHPEAENALNLLSGSINDSIMTWLNYQVDYLKVSPRQVAMDFLKAQNLYKPSRNGTKGTIRLGSKIFGEQYILINMYAMLIEGYTDMKTDMKTGLGGTKICFDALTNKEIDMYPEYTGTGLLVLLQPAEKTIEALAGDKQKVYDFVKQQFATKYQLDWLRPVGFNNSYTLMMRRKQAAQFHINTISQLVQYLEKP